MLRRFRLGRFGIFIPKIVEVEPVERFEADVLFQHVHIALHPLLHLLLAPFPAQLDPVGELLQEHVIAVAPPVQPKKQDHRHLAGMGQQNRAGRKDRLLAQEGAAGDPLIFAGPVPQHADEIPRLEAVMHSQGSRGVAQFDHHFGKIGIERVEHAGDGLVVALAHQNFQGEPNPEHSNGPQHLVTPQMRPQDDRRLSGFEVVQHHIAILHPQVQAVVPIGKEIHPVHQGGGEGVDMAGHVPQTGPALERPAQKNPRGLALRPGHDQEEEGDGIEQQAGGPPPQPEGDGADDPQPKGVAAFGMGSPKPTHLPPSPPVGGGCSRVSSKCPCASSEFSSGGALPARRHSK